MYTDEYLVSVIILNMNRKSYLRKCLNSVLNSSYKNLEVIVIDNGSTDSSQTLVKKEFPKVKLIENQQNLGFGGGNNIGIKNARGKLLFLINNDIFLDHLCIEKLVEKAMSKEDVGIFGCKIYFGYLNNILQHAGGILDNSGSGILRGFFEKDSNLYNIEYEVDWVHGAAIFIRKRVFEEIGLFDTIYHPIYHDEIDLCYRAFKSGFKILYIPTAIVYHYESVKSLKTLKTAFLRIRNQLIFVFKFYKLKDLLKLPFYEMKMVVNSSRSSKYEDFSVGQKAEMLLALMKAFFWIILNLDILMMHRYSSRQVAKK